MIIFFAWNVLETLQIFTSWFFNFNFCCHKYVRLKYNLWCFICLLFWTNCVLFLIMDFLVVMHLKLNDYYVIMTQMSSYFSCLFILMTWIYIFCIWLFSCKCTPHHRLMVYSWNMSNLANDIVCYRRVFCYKSFVCFCCHHDVVSFSHYLLVSLVVGRYNFFLGCINWFGIIIYILFITYSYVNPLMIDYFQYIFFFFSKSLTNEKTLKVSHFLLKK